VWAGARPDGSGAATADAVAKLTPGARPATLGAMRARAVLALVALLSGCRGGDDREPAALQGLIEHERRVVAAEVGGRLVEVAVERGQAVAAGARLARLDPAMAEAAHATRAAELEVARAQLALVSAGGRPEELGATAAQIRAARAAEGLARQELERAERLLAGNATTTSAVDTLRGQLDRVTAERQALEERQLAVRRGPRAEERAIAAARVEAAEAAVAIEARRVAQHEIGAAVAGVVVDVVRRSGEVVAPGAPIATIADLAHPFVDVFVPTTRIGAVARGQRAEVSTDDGARAIGVVEFLSPEAEFAPRFLFSERERGNLVVRVRIRLDDPEGRLRAGVPATVRLGAAP
jgi:HlyD family secretion protein